jgi:hypothetical protein
MRHTLHIEDRRRSMRHGSRAPGPEGGVMSAGAGARILVPVVGGDISAATYARARAALATPGAQVAIVHVAGPGGRAPARPVPAGVPRWRRLAEESHAFVDAVAGDPAAVIACQARRFASDVVLADRPASVHRPRPRRTRQERQAC